VFGNGQEVRKSQHQKRARTIRSATFFLECGMFYAMNILNRAGFNPSKGHSAMCLAVRSWRTPTTIEKVSSELWQTIGQLACYLLVVRW